MRQQQGDEGTGVTGDGAEPNSGHGGSATAVASRRVSHELVLAS